jgi:arylsulfatase A-like enzyme
MKAIMVMFDSLNRHMLPPYGAERIHAPNFERLAENTVIFDRAYVGSRSCIPARRELHTGRYNFLHRSWGPIEPFDDSMPQTSAAYVLILSPIITTIGKMAERLTTAAIAATNWYVDRRVINGVS